jgi:hypothetical protein
MFEDTPFGTVELINFRKVAPAMFNIQVNVFCGEVTYEEMAVTWANCHADDAWTYFKIEPSEQNMWGS